MITVTQSRKIFKLLRQRMEYPHSFNVTFVSVRILTDQLSFDRLYYILDLIFLY
jgi:hypothetical protein